MGDAQEEHVVKLPKPHRCNDRVEDVLQVRSFVCCCKNVVVTH